MKFEIFKFDGLDKPYFVRVNKGWFKEKPFLYNKDYSTVHSKEGNTNIEFSILNGCKELYDIETEEECLEIIEEYIAKLENDNIVESSVSNWRNKIIRTIRRD